MAVRDDEFRRLQAYHENMRTAIRYLDAPMARLAKAIKLAMKAMPVQKNILQLSLDEIEERLRRIRVRRMDLAPLPEEAAPAAPVAQEARYVPGDYGIEIISPTEGAAMEGVLQGALQQWHARIKPADGYLIPKERVRWSSDKEGVIKGIEETRLDEGRATHALIQFKFKIPGMHVVTVEAVDNRGKRYKATLSVKVIPALPANTRFTGEVPEEELLFRAGDYPSAQFVQPSDIGWQKGLPMLRNITFFVRLQSSDGKPFQKRNVSFKSDKDGNLGDPLVEFKDGATYAHVMFLFPTPGKRTISVVALDDAGKKASISAVLNILPRTTGELAEGEVPSTVEKLVEQKLRPALDDLHGIYNNARRHADRDMRFLVKWKRYVEKDFADVKDVGTDVQKDARDGKIDKITKHTKRLSRDLRAFESRIRLFNRAMREQSMLNRFLAQTRESVIAVRNMAREIFFEHQLLYVIGKEFQNTSLLYDEFAGASTGLEQAYAAIRGRVQEMGRRVQRIDSGVKHYKEDLGGMMNSLQSTQPHGQIAVDLASRIRDFEGTVQKELLADINGIIELLRGIIDDIAMSQQQLDRLEKLFKELKG